MNILFTTSSAPQKSPFFTNEKRPPLGVGSLISLVRKEGHKVDVDYAALGRKGGLKGGKARAEKLTPEQRSDIAKLAAKARWKKE